MLQISIPLGSEEWDEVNEEFIYPEKQVLQLEHSLVSISKWESKWCKPFLTNNEKSFEETLDYIKCMTLTKNVDPEVYNYMTLTCVNDINKYINAPMTGTTFSEDKKTKRNTEIVTAEVIYYWMIALNIPFECQKWHLNRLLTLIRVCNIKNQPAKKISKRDIMKRNTALNKKRRKHLKSRG